jgi:hypothetical protein
VGGAEFAQRAAVSLAVLTFVWGAFRFVSVVAGRRPWHLLPCIAMLAYGWVFHMGFFNFYLSMGLCFWVLALVWDWRPRGIAIAAPLLILAYVAQALPVVWMLGLLAYQAIARRISARARVYVSAAFMLSMLVLNAVVSRSLISRWSPAQIKMSTGADQLWVFDDKYYLVQLGLLVVWSLLFLKLVRGTGTGQVIGGIPFQLCVISAAAVTLLPTTILLPGFQHKLVFIAERMSLGVGVCVCALLGAAIPKAYERYALIGIAAIFFGFLFRDERILNRLEDRIDQVISQLPQGQRVISGIDDFDLHVFAVTHMVDRACIGRCYSYANYEPSTMAFRVRTVARNPYVTASYRDSYDMQVGTYVVRPSDLPLVQIRSDDGKIVVRELTAGAQCGTTPLKAL